MSSQILNSSEFNADWYWSLGLVMLCTRIYLIRLILFFVMTDFYKSLNPNSSNLTCLCDLIYGTPSVLIMLSMAPLNCWHRPCRSLLYFNSSKNAETAMCSSANSWNNFNPWYISTVLRRDGLFPTNWEQLLRYGRSQANDLVWLNCPFFIWRNFEAQFQEKNGSVAETLDKVPAPTPVSNTTTQWILHLVLRQFL